MTERGHSGVRRLAWALTLVWLAGCSSSPTAPQSPSSTTTATPPSTSAQTPAPVVAAEACAYTLSTTSQSIIGEGGSFSFNLTRTTGTCAWTATADSWITVSPSSGSGSTQVTATVGRNGSPERTGAITISWTSAADGPKSARLTVSQNDLVPLLTAGTMATEPQGGGLASATAIAFSLATNPSGGIPPYRYSWNFGDGSTATGTTPTHTYSTPGSLLAVLTVSDNRNVAATTQMTIPVDTVTGTWRTREVASNGGVFSEPVVLTQAGSAVTGTINDVFNGSPRSLSGSGNVSHPRKVVVTLFFSGGIFSPIVYTGTLDSLLTTWTGTVTGWSGCPCTFTAGKIAN